MSTCILITRSLSYAGYLYFLNTKKIPVSQYGYQKGQHGKHPGCSAGYMPNPPAQEISQRRPAEYGYNRKESTEPPVFCKQQVTAYICQDKNKQGRQRVQPKKTKGKKGDE